ncbi:hypothetical protein IU433_28885 [Nocardia puris]|nr:hypothetical protein [Nocardia puris]MBF6213896.1 hypothetical protein [Nocardia puris]MBF6368535.1 hypothetical protein [Nocardia puris]MBF6463022.1 hypothetical protein [Nocardia puris]
MPSQVPEDGRADLRPRRVVVAVHLASPLAMATARTRSGAGAASAQE